MADILSVTAGVVGIVAPALHAARRLLADIRKISGAPATVQVLGRDVSFVQETLEALEAIGQPQWAALGPVVAEQSSAIITACTASCTGYRADLQRWTRHSPDGGISWRDRTSIGLVRQDQIKAMSEQLRNYQAKLNLVVSTAILYSSIRGQRVTEELKTAIAAKEQDISDSIVSTRQQLTNLNDRISQLGLAKTEDAEDENDNADVIEGESEDKAGLGRVMTEEQIMLPVILALLDALKLKTQEEARRMSEEERKQLPQVTFGNNNSGFQLGSNSGTISGFTFGGT